jgi:steroid 5-alpha reductase family enzyme
MNALQITIIILILSIIVSFLYGLFTRNYSTVDRLWSVLPPVYALIWMYGHTGNTRLVLASVLVITWGVRLTYNFARRGGYSFSWKQGFTGEDYRWEIMREKIPNRTLFELFNLFFISIFQLVLVFAITLPLYVLRQNPAPLNRIDVLLLALHLLFLIGETISDNQQYNFQNEKRNPEFAGSYRHQLGFNTFGLWKYARHPNYFFEIAQWVIVALYAINVNGTFHPAAFGVMVLILLFIGSTNLTESITETKYLQYGEWKKYTFAWLPLPLKKSDPDFLESTVE